jgi:hypothetical protein
MPPLFFNDLSRNQGGFGRFWAGIGDLRAGCGRFARRHSAAFGLPMPAIWRARGKIIGLFVFGAGVKRARARRGGARREIAAGIAGKVSTLAPTPELTVRKTEQIFSL